MATSTSTARPESTSASNGKTTPKKDYKRDANGKFGEGNSGGPGNPFARKTAEMRSAFFEVISKEEFTALIRVTYQRAMEGDTACMRMIYSYMAGKPDVSPNPDTLDANEWEVLRQQHDGSGQVSQMMGHVSKEVLCTLIKAVMPCLDARFRDFFVKGLTEDIIPDSFGPWDDSESAVVPEEEEEAPVPATAAAKSTNGSSPAPKAAPPAKKTTSPAAGKPAQNGSNPKNHRQQTTSNGRATPKTLPEKLKDRGLPASGGRMKKPTGCKPVGS